MSGVSRGQPEGVASVEAERLIDALLDGELTGDAKSAALRRIAGEPAAARAYVSAQRAVRAVAVAPVPSFSVESNIMERLESRGVVRSRRTRRLVTAGRVAVAATVLLSVGAVLAVNRARPGTLGPAGDAPVTRLSEAIAGDAESLASRLAGGDGASDVPGGFASLEGLPTGAIASDTGAVEVGPDDWSRASTVAWSPEPVGDAAALADMLDGVLEGGGSAIVLASRPVDGPVSLAWGSGLSLAGGGDRGGGSGGGPDRFDGGDRGGGSGGGPDRSAGGGGSGGGPDLWLMGEMPAATVLPVTPGSGAWRGGPVW